MSKVRYGSSRTLLILSILGPGAYVNTKRYNFMAWGLTIVVIALTVALLVSGG